MIKLYLVLNNMEILIVFIKYICLKDVMLCEICWVKKGKYCMV